MIESLRRSNVAFYAIDPRGTEVDKTGVGRALPFDDIITAVSVEEAQRVRAASPKFSWESPVRLSRENLTVLTEATSGFAVSGTDDYRAGLERLANDFNHYYLLGFVPPDATTRRFRAVEVRVNRPGAIVRYRRGYQLGSLPQLPRNKDSMVAVSAGVLPKSDLALRLFASPVPSGKAPHRVALALEVRPQELGPLSADGVFKDTLDITAIVADLSRKKIVEAGRRQRLIQIKLQPGAPAAAMRYQVVTSIDVAPGEYQLRVSARSAAASRTGSVYLTVDVPDFSRLPVALGGIVLATSRQSAAGAAGMDADTLPFPPVLDRQFTSRDVLRVYCDVWRRDRGREVTATVEVIDATGRSVWRVERTIPPQTNSALNELVPLADFASGVYQLSVSARENTSVARREVPIIVK
jgi:hypothetical protein